MAALERDQQKYNKPVFFYVDEKMYEAIRNLSFSKRMSKSAWLRDAIEAQIEEDEVFVENKPTEACTEEDPVKRWDPDAVYKEGDRCFTGGGIYEAIRDNGPAGWGGISPNMTEDMNWKFIDIT